MIPLAYNVRSLLARKATSAAAALGLALTVFVFAAVMMMSNGVEQATRRAVDPLAAIVLRAGASSEIESTIEASHVARIASAPGVARTTAGQPRALGELIALVVLDHSVGGGLSNMQLRGIPDAALAFRPNLRIVAGRAPRPGAGEAIVGRAIRGRFRGLQLGERLELRKNRPLAIVGVFADDASAYESELWVDVNWMREAFGQGNVVSSARVQLTSMAAFDAFKTAVESDRELGVVATREAEFADKQTQGTAAFLRALGMLIALLFSLGAMIGAIITMHAAIAQRQREIGTLRALGFSRRQVLLSFLFEAIVLALAGGAAGVLAALTLSLQRIAMVNTATFAELSFAFEPTPAMMLIALLVAALMGVVGGLVPALRATRIDAAAALRLPL